jgi:hypothetical protein
MSESLDPIPDPSAYWQDAEKLLDEHFTRKRRRTVFFSAGIALISCFVFYYLYAFFTPSYLSEKKPDAKEAPSSKKQQPVASAHTAQPAAQVQTANPGPASTTAASDPASIAKAPVALSAEKPLSRITRNEKRRKRHTSLANTSYAKQAAVPSAEGAQPPAIESTKIQAPEPDYASQEIPQHPGMERLRRLPPFSLGSTTAVGIPGKNVLLLPSLKESTVRMITVYAGIQQWQKRVTGSAPASVIDRRNREEMPVWLSYGGISLSTLKGPWAWHTGIEFSALGEWVRYTPYAKGVYTEETPYWKKIQTESHHTDSIFHQGILYTRTRTVTKTNSVLSTKTDTLQGWYQQNQMTSANGVNKMYVCEIPLQASYTWYVGRLGLGIAAGIAPGILVGQKVQYVKEDESGLYRPQWKTGTRYICHIRAGWEVSYCVSRSWRVLVNPAFRYFITPIQTGNNMQQRYNAFGVNVGLMHTF